MKNKFFRRSIQLMAGGILLLSSFSALAENVVVICNKNVPEIIISQDDLKNTFLGKKSKWADGTKIELGTHQNENVHHAFLKAYIGRTASQFRNFWRKEVFTGKGRMPRAFGDDEQMIQFVMTTAAAIGYVSPQAKTDTVKVLIIK